MIGRKIFLQLVKSAYCALPSQRLRAACFAAFCSAVRSRRVVATVDGVTLDLDLGEVIELAVYLGQYEVDVVRATQRVCQRGMTVFDVGANVGAHTFRLARLVGSAGKVYAFEPTSYAFEKLTANIRLNRRLPIEPYRLALSNCNSPGREIRVRSSWPTSGAHNVTPEVVPFVRLDDFCAERGISRVDFLKVDIDGGEFAALAGALTTIEQHRPILIMEAQSLHFDSDATNPYLLLEKFDYSFWDTVTGAKYENAEAIGNRWRNGDNTPKTINVIARTAN